MHKTNDFMDRGRGPRRGPEAIPGPGAGGRTGAGHGTWRMPATPEDPPKGAPGTAEEPGTGPHKECRITRGKPEPPRNREYRAKGY